MKNVMMKSSAMMVACVLSVLSARTVAAVPLCDK